jgi:hypothetical protein
MLTYSEWKEAERQGLVEYVSEPYLRARKWHVTVLKVDSFCGEIELDDEREGLVEYLKELRTRETAVPKAAKKKSTPQARSKKESSVEEPAAPKPARKKEKVTV